MAQQSLPPKVTSSDHPDEWQALTDAAYGPTRNLPVDDIQFEGRLQERLLGTLGLTRIASTPIHYRRDKESTCTENFFISLTLCKEAHVEQLDRVSTQYHGDIVLYDGALPYACSFPQGDDQVVLSVPRALLLQHIGAAGQMVGLTLPGSNPLASIAGSMMQQAVDAGPLPVGAAHKLADSMLGVLANAFELSFTSNLDSSRRDSQLSRIKQLILANLGDHQLSLEGVSQSAHMSARTVSRLFAAQGTTFARWLWQQRLSACHQALIRGAHRSVTEVALTFGFSNPAHFSRAFRQAYGVAPSELMPGRAR
ncbi:helix-turn-helix domain-containing protein [Pseudomonas sp. NPDC089406]|uniref:helix-turn-helix domain-containing protein n=1 Tax=Pseudomonas sp. NPDC089406 TaxID=3364463 RepID=UPI00384DDC54